MRRSPFAFDRSWRFAVTPAELWHTLERTDRYSTWWPWLHHFDVAHSDGGPLTSGADVFVVIQAPLPYQLRCRIYVDDAEPVRSLQTTITGDLEGTGRLDLRATNDGRSTEARLAWVLDVRAPMLRRLSLVARPAMAWAHDRIVERGLRQFETHALQDRGAPTSE